MSHPVYRFLEYELVTARRELICNGELLSLEPKVYDLLLYLLERRDRSISKSDLQEAIWPNVLVTESSLSRSIMKARQAVADSANRQRVIKTVHSHGYRFVAEVEESGESIASSRNLAASHTTDRISIAVMPFDNLSKDEEQEFFADGLTQDITTNLSRNKWLAVVASSSSRYYKNKEFTHTEIAEQLGVRYLVQGSVRRSASKVRITASLVDATTGEQEWSEKYDRPLVDFFEIQDEISLGIASSLGAQVRHAEGKKAMRADAKTLDAWGLIHRGMEISWSRFNRQSNLLAEDLYRQAIAISPDNPKAQAALAMNLAMKVSNGWSGDIASTAAEAWRLGESAVAHAPNDPMILSCWGHQHSCLGKARAAVQILERAQELDPSSAWTCGLCSLALIGDGRASDALGKIGKALHMSPQDTTRHWHLAMYGFAYLQLVQYEDAARESSNSIASFGYWQPPWATLAVSLAGLDQWDEAAETARTAAELEPMVGLQGYARFFRFITRDENHADRIHDWLKAIWP